MRVLHALLALATVATLAACDGRTIGPTAPAFPQTGGTTGGSTGGSGGGTNGGSTAPTIGGLTFQIATVGGKAVPLVVLSTPDSVETLTGGNIAFAADGTVTKFISWTMTHTGRPTTTTTVTMHGEWRQSGTAITIVSPVDHVSVRETCTLAADAKRLSCVGDQTTYTR